MGFLSYVYSQKEKKTVRKVYITVKSQKLFTYPIRTNKESKYTLKWTKLCILSLAYCCLELMIPGEEQLFSRKVRKFCKVPHGFLMVA